MADSVAESGAGGRSCHEKVMIRRLINKFTWAWEGLVFVYKNEFSFRVELICAAIVLLAGLILGLGRIEWCIVLLGISVILSLEFLNTAIEKVLNFFHPNEHPEVKVIKDIAAGAVLIANLMALIIGALIFIPHFLRL